MQIRSLSFNNNFRAASAAEASLYAYYDQINVLNEWRPRIGGRQDIGTWMALIFRDGRAS